MDAQLAALAMLDQPVKYQTRGQKHGRAAGKTGQKAQPCPQPEVFGKCHAGGGEYRQHEAAAKQGVFDIDTANRGRQHRAQHIARVVKCR